MRSQNISEEKNLAFDRKNDDNDDGGDDGVERKKAFILRTLSQIELE